MLGRAASVRFETDKAMEAGLAVLAKPVAAVEGIDAETSHAHEPSLMVPREGCPPSLQRRRAGCAERVSVGVAHTLASLREGKLRASDLSLPSGARPCRKRRLRLCFVPVHPAIGSCQQPFVRFAILRKDAGAGAHAQGDFAAILSVQGDRRDGFLQPAAPLLGFSSVRTTKAGRRIRRRRT